MSDTAKLVLLLVALGIVAGVNFLCIAGIAWPPAWLATVYATPAELTAELAERRTVFLVILGSADGLVTLVGGIVGIIASRSPA